MARINIITNLTNGAGLQRDYELLRAELERRGHAVHGIHYQSPDLQAGDVNIFLEVIEYRPKDEPERHVRFEDLAACAPQQWLVPNPEWWFRGWPLDVWDVVLTKTRDATRIFTEMVGDRCEYLGWQAHDFYDPTIPRQRAFLHVAGKSKAKNTPAVLDGARRTGVPLTVVAEGHQRVTDEELRHLLNSHMFCVLPSAYEGYGHALHEAYGCGQVVLTTNAPPMNETRPAIFITTLQRRTHHCGVLHEVTGRSVGRAMRAAMALTDDQVRTMSQQVRAAFDADRAVFQANLDRVLEARL